MSHFDDSELMDLSQTPSPIRAPPPSPPVVRELPPLPPPPPPVGAPPPLKKGNCRNRKRKQNSGERSKIITVS